MDTAVVISAAVAAAGGAAAAALILKSGAAKRLEQALKVERERQATQLDSERAKLAAQHAEAEARLQRQAAERQEADRRRLEEELAAERRALRDERTVVEQQGERIARREESLVKGEEKLHRREDAFGDREAQLDARMAATARRESELERRDQALGGREQQLATRATELDARSAAVEERGRSIDAQLQAVAGLTVEEARAQLLARLDADLAEEQARLIAKRNAETTERAREQALEIVSRAIQRYAAEHTAETTTAKITLPDEEMKGRIIGKEGRNIRAFEQSSGVDLIIDDTPGVIIVSCFDGVRREVARRALLNLMEDGRIHPARIEEVIAKTQQDMDAEVLKLGEDAAYACDVSALHPQIVRLLGKLQYRTSYGQNVLKHTQEVAFLCGAMAADMGLDPKLGRRCGLLHDIGKALDHEQEGSHPVLGHEVLKRYGESEIVANAALAHHEGHEVLSAYTVLAAAADAISAARPGARRENVERYIKRLQQLEDIACDFQGVMKAYAIQAGRELRVIVNGHTLPDAILPKVARDIARRIEEEVTYPGEVKVTVIREMRQFAVAR